MYVCRIRFLDSRPTICIFNRVFCGSLSSHNAYNNVSIAILHDNALVSHLLFYICSQALIFNAHGKISYPPSIS